jgi:hypothetical protein
MQRMQASEIDWFFSVVRGILPVCQNKNHIIIGLDLLLAVLILTNVSFEES